MDAKKGQSETNGQIQEVEGLLKGIREQIEAERRRLQAFGNKDVYYDALRREKQLSNELEVSKSKKRSQNMERIAREEIAPRVESFRTIPMDEKKRIETMLEVALYSEVIHRMKTHYLIWEEVDEVRFRVDDPAMRIQFGEKMEEITSSIKRTRDDIGQIRTERMVLKNPDQTILISLPAPRAAQLEKEGKGKIIESGEPIWIERIREDREPEIMESLRNMSLGYPIPVNGEISDEAKALQKRCVTGRLELSPTCFSQFIDGARIKKISKRFE